MVISEAKAQTVKGHEDVILHLKKVIDTINEENASLKNQV